MKKIFNYIFISFAALSMMTACSDDALETSPTSSAGGEAIFSTASNALISLNGVYRAMYTSGVSNTVNTHQCFGITAYALMADVMGEDCIMSGAGSGWFWYDCTYDVKSKYASEGWRPYEMWNGFYTWIANVNYIIAAADEMEGTTEEKNYVVGQAYAVRAYSYFMLAQTYARTYKGHESEPCVPVYTEPTDIKTQGKPRSTVEKVYEQITSDINTAVDMLKGIKRQHVSHIDEAVALGIKARVAQVMEDWPTAFDAATSAITASGCTIQEVEAFTGLNNTEAKNVMWGAEILKDQSGMYASLFAHMDADAGAYGETARKQVNKELYNSMKQNDTRRTWWNKEDKNNGLGGYQQEKFKFSNIATWEGDYIFMRVEEMYLIAAEAACRNNDDINGRKYLKDLLEKRGLAAEVSYINDLSGTTLGTTTKVGATRSSLLEEIIFNRRVELWGEFGRIYDIRRLKQGFTRTTDMGWPESALITGTNTQDPESYAWVLTIPQSEFDGNPSLDQTKDQNPMDDTKE